MPGSPRPLSHPLLGVWGSTALDSPTRTKYTDDIGPGPHIPRLDLEAPHFLNAVVLASPGLCV